MNQLVVEEPDGRRFLVEDITAFTLVKEIATSILSQYDESVWPRNGRVVVDIIEEDSTCRRLDPRQSLKQARIKDGHTLRVAPELTAGGDLVGLVVSMVTGAVGTYALNILKLWLEARKSREIRIKYEGLEVTVKGPITERQIEQQLKIFSKYKERFDRKKLSVEISDLHG